MRFLKALPILGLMVLLVVMSACSQPTLQPKEEKKPQPKSEETVEETKEIEPASELEGMLQEGPGKYGGDAYDEEAVKAELDQLPDGLSPEEAYKALINLLAEDYQPVVEKINRFDTTYDVRVGQPGGAENTTEANDKNEQLNVVILLDASGSMAGRVDGGVKMDLAKDAVARFASSLPKEANVSLRVYGHKGGNSQKDKAVSCKSTEEVYTLNSYDEQKFNQSLKKFRPTGWTPIAASIEVAHQDLLSMSDSNAKNIVYIVSDGEETCGGDPVKAAKKLHQSNIEAVVNIIGFDVDHAGQKALQAVAKAGGGEYQTVKNQKELRGYFDTENTQLYLDWSHWGNQSWLDIESQWAEKYNELQKLNGLAKGSLYHQISGEYSRMNNALTYLNNQGKIELGDRIKTNKYLEYRRDLLLAYQKKSNDELNGAINRNKKSVQAAITEKQKEMKEKYKSP